jgi:ribosomal protein S18 acetylase RimI-like enzyme
MACRYKAPDSRLSAAAFLDLANRVWPGNYNPRKIRQALRRTLNITAWEGKVLVGCVRVLTDGYLFSTVPEILVDPRYQRRGIGRRLMALAFKLSPGSLFLGAQPGNEGFFEKSGFERVMAGYVRRKPRAP